MIVRESDSGTAVVRALDPDAYLWGLREQLLAGIFDLLNVLAWQNTKDGQEGRNPPTPIERPGVKAERTTFSGGSMTLEQAEAALAARNPLQHQKG